MQNTKLILRYTIRKVNHKTTVKTTINIDEETWNRFKRAVSSSQGSLRNLSGAVKEAIRALDAEYLIRTFAEKTGIEAGRYPSLREVEESRPRPGTSTGETIRRMRDEGDARISGHERPR